MLGIFNMLMGRPACESEKDAVLGRLQKQTQKSNNAEGNRDEISDLDVLNHKHRAVLLSKDLGTERDRWPKLRTQAAMNTAARGDGFWDRAVSGQNGAQQTKAQILGSMNASRMYR
ncbi:MAG: hypothetical protein K2X77_32315 [Candidatus Obscuribacterales bacterium]|jgi:hypothetical protein|nr:hypothetical protein [Candidatus Obscuribacterales bacterium]